MNKVVRLPDGRFITRKLVESDPRALAAAKPEEIWTTGEGRDVLIRDMEVTHLVNAMRVQVQQAYTKMKMLGLLSDLPDLGDDVATYNRSLEKIMVEIPDRAKVIIEFAQSTMPKFSVMKDELDIRLGRKERKPATASAERKFDFS